jgi:hypothetical protein
LVVAPANSVKFRNVRHNPKVSLSIAPHQRLYKYVVLEGEGWLSDDNLTQVLERLCLRNAPDRGRDYPGELLARGEWLVLEVEVHRVLSHKSDE